MKASLPDSSASKSLQANSRSGFTLVELVASIAVIAVLASSLFAGVRGAIEMAKSAKCKSNLRTLYNLAEAYRAENLRYPWGRKGGDEWDFKSDGTLGEIFDEDEIKSALCCPKAPNEYGDWDPAKFTGYNYNCFAVGKCEGDKAERDQPASEVSHPESTAMFGDAGWAEGHNKFMRAPKASREYDYSSSGVRNAGTQSFRHRGSCNVVFCDGHVTSLRQSYKSDGSEGYVNDKHRTGFLGPDNYIYGGKPSK